MAYASFVGANYADIAAKHPGQPAAAIMPLVAAAWKQVPEEKKAAMKEECTKQVSHEPRGRVRSQPCARMAKAAAGCCMGVAHHFPFLIPFPRQAAAWKAKQEATA